MPFSLIFGGYEYNTSDYGAECHEQLQFFDSRKEKPPDDNDSIIEWCVHQANHAKVIKTYPLKVMSELSNVVPDPKMIKADPVYCEKLRKYFAYQPAKVVKNSTLQEVRGESYLTCNHFWKAL